MSYRYERYRERPRSQMRSCLVVLTVCVWLVVFAWLAVRFWVRPLVTDYVNQQVAVAIDPQLPADLAPGQALQESLEQVPIPVQIPAGTITVTEDQANSYLTGYRDQLAEIDDIRVRFVPGAVQAEVTVRGFRGTASTEPVVEGGRLVATNTSLSQPLGSFLSINPLMQALLDRINGEVTAQGRTITAVQIEQGTALVTVE